MSLSDKVQVFSNVIFKLVLVNAKLIYKLLTIKLESGEKYLTIVIDPSRQGLEKVLRDYQIESLKTVWENANKGVTSREVYVHVNKALTDIKTISRASIINFLNDMCDEGVLTYEEETCKGGMRRKYFPGLDEEGFKKYIAKTVFESLIKDFPDQTIEALSDSLSTKPAMAAKLQKSMVH